MELPLLNLHTHRNGPFNVRSCDPIELDVLPLEEQQWFSTGLHPWWLNTNTWNEQWKKIEALINRPGLLAIGEVGLDRRSPVDLAIQTQVLVRHIELALELGLPLILHLTDYFDVVMQLRKKYPKGLWIWHSFNGHATMYRQLLKTNTDFSIGRKLLLQNSPLENLIEHIPEDRFWLESDQEDDLVLRDIYKKVSQLRKVETDILSQHIFVRFEEVIKKSK